MTDPVDVESYDVVVVGAGLMGSSAAYYSARAGQRVLLVEQYGAVNARGSSGGTSRIFRVAYPDPMYTRMCINALEMWREIEAAASVQLLEMTGELDFADRPSDKLDEVCKVLTAHQLPFDVLTGTQVNVRYPGFSLPADAHAVFNPTAAILNPTLARQSLQKLAVAHGATVLENCSVLSFGIAPSGDLIVVGCANGRSIRARQCIVTAGPWTNELLGPRVPTARIRPIATFGTYWKCHGDSQAKFVPARLPVFINYQEPWIFGLPMQDPRDGVKVCVHTGPDVDPNWRQELTEQSLEDLESIRGFLRRFMPAVDSSQPSRSDLCMYSMTADDDFILDLVDVDGVASHSALTAVGGEGPPKLVVGAGFSGHGAKMTPVIGKILADLAIHGQTSYPIERFRLARSAAATGATN